MNTILAALVNGAILGALAAAAVWLVLRLAPRRVLSAATRYVLWWATLALAIVLPVLYLPMPIVSRAAPHRAEAAPAAPVAARTYNIAAMPPTAFPPTDDRPLAIPTRPSFPIQIAAAGWTRWVFAAWLSVSLLLLIRLAVSCVLLGRRSARACDAPERFRAHLDKWLAVCGAGRRGIRLASSTEIEIPVAVGPRHPSILIPARLFAELEYDELDQIGIHEAAHLSRGDDYALIAQRIVEALFAFHPVVRWIARQIDLEREIACDDLVVAATGHPRSYATCLTRVVELCGCVRSSIAGAAAADDRSHLARRVDMLLDKTRHTGTRLLKARFTAMAATLAALAWVGMKTPALVAFAAPVAQIVRQAPARIAMLVQAAETPQGSVQGPGQGVEARVVEDSSDNPLATAELRFHKAGMRELAADLDTDGQGRIRVPSLPPGDYTVDISKPNYVTASFKLRVPVTGLLVRLVRYAVIAGQVTDTNGQPVPGRTLLPGGRTAGSARITVLVKAVGGEELRSIRETTLEEGGRYRVFDLPPGQYALGLWYAGLSVGSGMQLYPDNAHPRFFTVSGGEDYRDINFTIVPRAVYQVSGKIDLPKKGDSFALALGLPEQPALPIAQTLTDSDGSFHFEKVPQGTYDLFVAGPVGGYGAFDNFLKPQRLFGRARVQVGGQNIEGLSVPLGPARSIAVVLRAHGDGPPAEGCPQSAAVALTPLEPWGSFVQSTVQASFAKEQTAADLAPGRYRLAASALGPNCHQVNQPVIDLSGSVAQPVAIELAAAGSIRGVLREKGFAVVLLDVEATQDAQAQLAFPDAEGRFVFEGLHPGHYRIAAEPAAQASKARWVGDPARMTAVEVAAGKATDLELKGGQR